MRKAWFSPWAQPFVARSQTSLFRSAAARHGLDLHTVVSAADAQALRKLGSRQLG